MITTTARVGMHSTQVLAAMGRTATISLPQGGNDHLQRAFGLFRELVAEAPYRSLSHLEDHTLRMLRNLPLLNLGNSVNVPLLEIAVVLHDVGVYYTQEFNHGPKSAEILKPKVGKLGYTAAEQKKILQIISRHHEIVWNFTEEDLALQLLDALDTFGPNGIYRFMEIYYRRGEIEPSAMFTRIRDNLDLRRGRMKPNQFKYQFDFEAFIAAYERTRAVFSDEPTARDILSALEAVEFDLERLAKTSLG